MTMDKGSVILFWEKINVHRSILIVCVPFNVQFCHISSAPGTVQFTSSHVQWGVSTQYSTPPWLFTGTVRSLYTILHPTLAIYCTSTERRLYTIQKVCTVGPVYENCLYKVVLQSYKNYWSICFRPWGQACRPIGRPHSLDHRSRKLSRWECVR